MAKPTDRTLLQSGDFIGSAAFAHNRGITAQTVAKRGFDLVAAFLILLVVAPAMLAIWVAVRRDGGKGLYGHRRVGQDGRVFQCYKFRTMVTDADAMLAALLANDAQARMAWEESRKLVDDPRVTPIGRFLRASSLDELPQLFNVLRGDMSLVGPRPVVSAEIEQFYRGADRAAYLSVRPGLTGLWQVSGRSDVSYERRARLDREYVNRASFWLDVLILCRTVGVVLRRRGAY